MAILSIDRKSSYICFGIVYNILLNGKKIGILTDGDFKTYNIPAGKYTLYLKTFFYSSNIINFEIDDYTTIILEVKQTLINPKIIIKSKTSAMTFDIQYNELQKINKLKTLGVLTEEEYKREKNKLLKRVVK